MFVFSRTNPLTTVAGGENITVGSLICWWFTKPRPTVLMEVHNRYSPQNSRRNYLLTGAGRLSLRGQHLVANVNLIVAHSDLAFDDDDDEEELLTLFDYIKQYDFMIIIFDINLMTMTVMSPRILVNTFYAWSTKNRLQTTPHRGSTGCCKGCKDKSSTSCTIRVCKTKATKFVRHPTRRLFWQTSL